MFAHERQVNSMAAKTFSEWWGHFNIDDDPTLRQEYSECWNAAIASMEGVQTQTTNSRYVAAIDNIREVLSCNSSGEIKLHSIKVILDAVDFLNTTKGKPIMPCHDSDVCNLGPCFRDPKKC
jgi:hypothetical protein